MKLYARGKKGTLSVKYRIPTHMRAVLGREKTYDIWKSTGTSDAAVAARRAPRIMADIIDGLEAEYASIQANAPARNQHDSVRAAMDLMEQVARGELDTDSAREILEGVLEDSMARPKASPTDQRHALTAARMVSSAGSYLPLSVAAEKHYDDMERRGVTVSAIDYARNTLEDFGNFTGDPDVSEVSRKMAGDWIAANLTPLKLAESTKVKRIGFLKSAWSFFVRTSLADLNPFEDMDALVRGSKRGHKKLVKRAWTPEEVSKLSMLDETDPMAAVAIIRLHSGARVEEVCGLRVEDIDLQAGTMNIGHTEDGAKTQSSVRTLPLHPVARRVIESLMENPTPDGRLLNLSRAGSDMTYSHNLNKKFGRWIRKHVSTDPALTSYTLRHTYAQAMRDLGVDKETIEFTTGHKDQSMLFSTYATGVGIGRLQAAIEQLDFGF